MGDNVALGLPSDVVVRRTVGMKKDEYLLNNKRADMQDVINLFETIGFSRCNPYNIVLQGQVEQLTAMSPSDRLGLIKDIAGASLYDDKKEESEKLLTETEVKMEKVAEVIASLEDRISSLGAEKEELMAYQSADKRRRALEHRSRDLEMESVERKSLKLEVQRTSLASQSTAHYATINDLENNIETNESLLREMQKKREMAESRYSEASSELAHLTTLNGKLSLELGEIDQDSQNESRLKTLMETEKAQKEFQLSSKESLLTRATNTYQLALSEEKRLKAEADEADRQVKELQSKKGRTKFSTKKERDSALNKEISHLQDSIKVRRNQTDAIESSIAELQKEEASLDEKTKNRANRHAELMDTVTSSTNELASAKKKRDTWADSRKAAWQEQKATEEDIFAKRAMLAHHQKQVHSTLPRELVAGLEAVAKLEVPQGQTVYGPLIDLIEIPEHCWTAAEVTAGNSLFHVLVDTDSTASWVLNQLQRQNLGRVTCIPLNRVMAADYVADLQPELDAKNIAATAMTSLVKPRVVTFQPALNQVFGKSLLCADLPLAVELSREYKCACVTLDGNQVNSKGALTGGFIDDRVHRIRSSAQITKLSLEIKSLEEKLKKLRVDAAVMDDRITSSIKEMAESERQRATALYELEAFSEMTRSLHRELLSTREALNKRRVASDENEAVIQQMTKTRDALSSERDTPMAAQLTDSEAEILATLSASLAGLESRLLDALSKRANAEFDKKSLEEEIEGQLRPQLGDLESKLAEITMKSVIGGDLSIALGGGGVGGSSMIESSHHSSSFGGSVGGSLAFGRSASALGSLSQVALGTRASFLAEIESNQSKIDDLKIQMSSLESEIATYKAQISNLLTTLASDKDALSTALKRAAQVSEDIEKLFGEMASVQSKKEDLQKRLREIGILPTALGAGGQEWMDEYGRLTLEQCRDELVKEKQKLARFDHVNKKALDQFLSFTEEKEKFATRKEQMEREHAAIQRLIQSLDMQKDNAVLLTFKGISKSFTTTFANICPGGTATMVMKDREVEAPGEAGGRRKEFVGIDLRVSFTPGVHKEGPAIRQLSGGQRTVTSLSLIFAIQQSDRAPFYIFDEIDPALDDRYRASIAKMIQIIAKDGYQFVIVTHRPEMVQIADKSYVVSFSNRSSEIHAVDSETALEIVAQAEAEATRQSTTAAKKRAPAPPAGANQPSNRPMASPSPSVQSTPQKARSAPARGGDDEEEEDELVVRFDRRAEDNQPFPFPSTPDADVLESKPSRPKRARA